MKQETLEEAMMKDGYWESDYDKIWREGVQFGAKWQEERVDELLNTLLNNNMCSVTGDELIEQFKKKGGDK
jgi:hypothetical protein